MSILLFARAGVAFNGLSFVRCLELVFVCKVFGKYLLCMKIFGLLTILLCQIVFIDGLGAVQAFRSLLS